MGSMGGAKSMGKPKTIGTESDISICFPWKDHGGHIWIVT